MSNHNTDIFLCITTAMILMYSTVVYGQELSESLKTVERHQRISGIVEEKGYVLRLQSLRALVNTHPLPEAETNTLLALLYKPNSPDMDEMEFAALKNDVTEYLLKHQEEIGKTKPSARDLLDMQSDEKQTSTWRNYCIQFLGVIYPRTSDDALRAEVRERLYTLADDVDNPSTSGTAMLALLALKDFPEIDGAYVGQRAYLVAHDAQHPDSLRLTALQVAIGFAHERALPLARQWLNEEKSINLKTVAIGILGKSGHSEDLDLIRPYLQNPDPRLNTAARMALGLPRML